MEYEKQLELNRLRREAFFTADPAQRQDALTALNQAPEQQDVTPEWLILKSKSATGLLSAATTGLDATITVKLPQIPTSIVHLLEQDKFPLVHCRVANTRAGKRRVRVTSYVEGYSAKAVDTLELNDSGSAGFEREFLQLPSFFPEAVRNVQDITRAMLNVLIDDLDTGKIEVHVSKPVWLLPRSSAPRSLRDPNGKRLPVDKFLAAFVTPNAQSVFEFLGEAVKRHPLNRFAGYQDPVEPQARALFDALQKDIGLRYINSVVAFSMEGWASQRVRLPRESLTTRSANCIDGVVLFASLLEAISLSTAIAVIDQGHAMVAWESAFGSAAWTYLETTRIGSPATFDDALQSGKEQAGKFLSVHPPAMDTLPLRVLRQEFRIMPLE